LIPIPDQTSEMRPKAALLEVRKGLEPSNSGFAGRRVCHFATAPSVRLPGAYKRTKARKAVFAFRASCLELPDHIVVYSARRPEAIASGQQHAQQ
jgi:hypothetical protein